MLERATACLKSGAARESLRCVTRMPRSKRMLHSTFWTHGAGDLDLPPWALSMFPTPTELPLRGDDKSSSQEREEETQHVKVQYVGHGMTDGVFLDFLYPQQALALLHKRSTQQSQRWEKRNARRLPDGFVVASRGYASRSKTAKAKRARQQMRMHEEGDEEGEQAVEPEDSEQEPSEERQRSSDSDSYHPVEVEAECEEAVMDFADSPMDLADPSPEASRQLRNIMTFNKKKIESSARASQLIDQAWRCFQMLDDVGQDDDRLRTEFLSWLNIQETEKSDAYCAELYHSMPREQRTLRVYEIALTLFMRKDQHLSASKLHKEALQNLENGYQISKTLFRYTIDQELWHLAMRTESRHRESYGDSSQMQLFWVHVSEMPQLLSKAIKLARFVLPALRQRKDASNAATQKFCITFFKEAIVQEFLQADSALYTLPEVSNQPLPSRWIRRLFDTLAERDPDARSLFEGTLFALIAPDARIPYPRIHTLVTSIYDMYKTMGAMKPSEALLMTLLLRVTENSAGLRKDKATSRSISVDSLANDWQSFHGRLSVEAHVRLVTYYARNGRIESFDKAMAAFKEQYPDSHAWKGALWTSIYLHARRADLNGAQQAFAEVRRELSEFGEEPDLKCWNTLLHAHSRADDPEGGLTNLQNLIDYAKLTPDAHSFHPLTEVFARRGDVDGVEDLLDQYDTLTQAPRTVPLLGSLITAFVRSDEVETAEKVLKDTIVNVRKGEVTGSLTKCFNIVLTAHASSRDLDATRRTYRWMRDEKIRLDADSYSALVFALSVCRQTDAAYKIVTSAMKETAIQPTAFHYSVVMAGYNNVGRARDALNVHEDMMKLNIKPSMSTRATYLQALAIEEHRGLPSPARNPYEHLEPLDATLEELSRLVQTSEEDGGVSAKTPQLNLRGSGLRESDLAAHFDTLIFIHGKRRCFDVVERLYKQYMDTAAQRDIDEDAAPVQLLGALLSAYWRAGDYDAVESTWKLAKKRVDAVAPTIAVPLLSRQEQGEESVQPGQQVPDALELQPPPDVTDDPTTSRTTPKQTLEQPPHPTPTPRTPAAGRRHVLTRALRYYLAALYAQNRLKHSIDTVASLLTEGYVLDNRTFNYFVESLCRAAPPLALLAFSLTEKFMIPNFPGWNRKRRLRPSRPSERAEGLQMMPIRYLKPGLLVPQYRVLVRLGSALLDVRRLESLGRRGGRGAGKELERFVGTLGAIRRSAPRTLFAVQSMPRREDRLQSRLLRREE